MNIYPYFTFDIQDAYPLFEGLFFLKKVLEDISVFRGATDTPVLDSW